MLITYQIELLRLKTTDTHACTHAHTHTLNPIVT